VPSTLIGLHNAVSSPAAPGGINNLLYSAIFIIKELYFILANTILVNFFQELRAFLFLHTTNNFIGNLFLFARRSGTAAAGAFPHLPRRLIIERISSVRLHFYVLPAAFLNPAESGQAFLFYLTTAQ